MNVTANFLAVVLIFYTSTVSFSQDLDAVNDLAEHNFEESFLADYQSPPADNGYSFETFKTKINSKYADYGVGFYRDKFISFSARKIGALAKIDPKTKEPYTKLYCSDISADYNLTRPLLFSSLLNKNENLGSLAFANEGNTLYFTKSKKHNTQSFDLYRAEMNPSRDGEWVNLTKLTFNSEDYSIENPHISRDGNQLFFASNSPEAIGGYDIFTITIENDHPLGSPKRVEGSINTVLDEKFPYTSLDGKYLYFSSTGHDSNGGFDIYRSRNARLGYVSVSNLGNTINTEKDEIAYIQGSQQLGYMTSNREGGKGAYDIYKIKETILDLRVAGQILDKESQLPLANAAIVLLDEYGEEVAMVRSNADGRYKFIVDPYLNYTVLAYKNKFERATASIRTSSNADKTFEVNINLTAEAAPIVITPEKTILEIDNIQFDYDSATIKEAGTITLNRVVTTLFENSQIHIVIRAHTDSAGSEAYNSSLSTKRALSAMEYLLRKGISKNRLSAEGLGELEPLYVCNTCTSEQNESNRRVEFIVVMRDDKE